MLLAQHNVELQAVASEERKRNQEELKDRMDGSSRELREVKGNVEAQAVVLQENSSLIGNLFQMVQCDIVAPMRSVSQTVTRL